MKKSLLATFLITTTAFITNAKAQTWDCSPAGSTGTCTATLVNGKMTISGTGPMKDYTYTMSGRTTNTPWFSYRNQITSVEIEDGITSIGLGAFQKATNLTSVSIPTSVTTISDRAFESTGISSITIPQSVTSIGYASFYNAQSLSNITLPNYLTNVGGYDSTAITSITIPEGVTSLYNHAFANTSNLTSVTLPDSLTRIGEDTFGNSNIRNITLPENLEYIGNNAFACSQLESINVPASVKQIDQKAFNSCLNLTSVTLSEGLESIGYWAFRLTPIEEITIPDTVKFIAREAFNHCMSLTSVTFSPTDDLVIEGDAFHDLLSKISSGQITFNCAGDIEKCRAKLSAAGYNTCTIVQAAYDIKDENGKKIRHVNADGTYYDYPEEDENGATLIEQVDGSLKVIDANGHVSYRGKRIYTVEEASEVAGDVNRVSIKYK